jgi:FtsP/CotA-like multicopper oxidase with cupredoxin domain
MQFTVKGTTTNGVQGVASIAAFPAGGLNPTLPTGTFPTLQQTTPPIPKRYITLVEVMGPKGPVMVLINGQYYNAPVTETPTVGTEEDWVIINLTADTHPIHTHLVTFQLVSRDVFNKNGVTKYTNDWTKLQQDPILKTKYAPPFPRTFTPIALDPTPYLSGLTTTALPTEMGWKDTIQMHPGEVTTIRVRFTSQDGSPFSAFDPTVGPGYVYHCHILDHEDNEMMRPFIVLP